MTLIQRCSRQLSNFEQALAFSLSLTAKAQKVLHQNNARVRTCTTAKIHKLGYELILYLAYSPDLA